MAHFAAKRLAAVEVVPGASHQHELNATALWRGLGFPKGRSEGGLSLLCYLTPGNDPVLLEGSFTLYNSRAKQPRRSPEYRLYYRLPGLEEFARPEDLLVLCRAGAGAELHGLIARPGTPMERQLERLLRLGDDAALRNLVVREAARPQQGDAVEWVGTLFPAADIPTLGKAVSEHALLESSVASRRIPSTRAMADAGRDLARDVWGTGLNADEYIQRGLEAESGLYFAIEKEVGGLELRALLRDGAAELDEMLAWALRIQQSRKSRRGQSLQHHFASLLDREGIPYAAQCQTEGSERPDFIIPGHAQYHDPAYPADRLMMVACKSTVRERWAQVLREAERIRTKFLLTVDEGMSAELLRSMNQRAILVFVPTGISASAYAQSDMEPPVESVEDLLDRLRTVI
ncbi:MAG: type II restriction endonuclease [Gemmatimonadales bacterium]